MTTAEQRFRKAFNTLLEDDPSIPPGPTSLNFLMERGRDNNRLNGRETALRRQLLLEAGFVKDSDTGRWHRGDQDS